MEFDKDTFLSKVQEIGTCEDDVQRRTMLAELSEGVSKVYDDYSTNQTTITELNNTITKNNEDMEKLRQANMSLFLRVGENKTQTQVTKGSTGVDTPEPNKRKFEDLFKEEEVN